MDALICRCGRTIRIVTLLGNVDQRGADECWPWLRGTGTKGYGTACHLPAHRAVFIAMHYDPRELQVLHSCDNRVCCNWTAHLRAGTPKDNYTDAANRGRTVAQLAGAASLHTKLTQQDVDEMRRLAGEGSTQRELAAQYGMSQSGVWSILNNRTWVINQAARAAVSSMGTTTPGRRVQPL